jgi:nucleotidyltransferase/DNA polymerase involved in DNA repair
MTPMDRPAIEAAIAKLNLQRSTSPGPERTSAIDEALAELNKVAPATLNRTVKGLRQFIHSSDECDINIGISPTVFNVIVNWDD